MLLRWGRAVALPVCLALLAIVPGGAAADWQAVPTPPGGVRSFAAASADSLLVESNAGGGVLEVTSDGGANWQPVDLGDYAFLTPLGATPDGSYRIVAAEFQFGGIELQVFRVASTGDAEPLGPTIEEGGNQLSSHNFGLDDEGRVWIAYYDEVVAAYKLATVAGDGAIQTELLPAVGAAGWTPRWTVFGIRLQAIGSPGSPSPRGTYAPQDGGGFAAAEAYPVDLVEGPFWYSPESGQASWDGGAHWSETFELGTVVPRAGAGPRFLVSRNGIAERYSDTLYRVVAPEGPPGVSTFDTVDVGDALVTRDFTTLYVQSLPLPPLPTEIGLVPQDSRAMVDRANLFRADAGLPPLIADAAISLAAHNHSAYTARHPDELEGLSAHGETPGRAGFTGRGPSERCEAVGARCGGEVMYSPVDDPVGGWLATVYHRGLPGSPEAGSVGGGKVDDGWYVMDGGADAGVLLRPFGYPVGRWRGEDGFGGEIPDPADACRESGQAVSYPLGIAVTLYVPEFGRVERIAVRRHGSDQVLSGCLLSNSFVLDDPLVEGETYDVTATWNPGGESLPDGGGVPGPDLNVSWSFHFQPDSHNERTRRKTCRGLGLRRISSVAPAHRPRARATLGIEERVVLKQPAKVKLRGVVLNYWKAHRRFSTKLKAGRIGRHPLKVGRTSFLRFRLPARVVANVEPGEDAELRLSFVGRRLKGCKRPSHFSRIRKIQLGWVSVRGSADWVSARGGGRRSR